MNVFTLALIVAVTARSASVSPLRVCSDPNNLPFSNDKHQGFENRIADLLARDLGASVEYTWHAQRRGFLRETLQAGRCDVIIGYPTRGDGAQTTRPYYRSSYVFVSRQARSLQITSFDDPSLRRLRIGVQVIGDDGANAPPAHALSRRGIVRNLVGYSVYGDYAQDSPPSRIVTAVVAGDVDVAAVWGPLAGFFAERQNERLQLQPVHAGPADPPMVFDMSMAVRRNDTHRLARLNRFITRHQGAIDRVLDEFHVPRLPLPEFAQ